MADAVTTRPQLPHEARGLSYGRVDGVEASWHRDDAVRVEAVCVEAPSGRDASSAAREAPARPRGPHRAARGPHRHAIELASRRWRRYHSGAETI